MSSHYGWKSERGTHCLSHPMESSSHGINPQGLPCPWVQRWLGRRMMWSGSYARESLQRPLQNLKLGRAAGMVCPPPPLQAAAIPEMALGRPVPNPPTPGPSDGVRSSEGSGMAAGPRGTSGISAGGMVEASGPEGAEGANGEAGHPGLVGEHPVVQSGCTGHWERGKA